MSSASEIELPGGEPLSRKSFRSDQRLGGSVRIDLYDNGAIDFSVVSRLDPDGSKQKTRRARYQGSCVVCGAATNGSGGRAKVPKYCSAHVGLDPDWLEAHTKWPADRIIAAIQAWHDEYGEPPAIGDWNPWKARHVYHDEARATRADRLLADGRVPALTTVTYHFGTWNAALAAAGVEPRAPHGGDGNNQRRRDVRAKAKEAA